MRDKKLKSAIVKAAFKAFSQTPYQKVSTNAIIQEAGVSKGLLFHYFKNKENLYLSLYDMAFQTLYKEIDEAIDYEDRDVFERLKNYLISKTRIMQNHRTLTAFIKQVHLCNVSSIAKKRSHIYHGYTERTYRRIFDNIDRELLLDDLALDETFKVVTWTLQRITSDWEKSQKDKDNNHALTLLEDELTHYISFFKQAFYK